MIHMSAWAVVASRRQLRLWLAAGALVAATALSSCSSTTAPVQTTPSPQVAAPAMPILPLDKAVLQAADAAFTQAEQAAGGTGRRTVVIDPLIEGVTGFQTEATRSIQGRVEELVAQNHPSFEVLPFTAGNLEKASLVLVGSLTGIDRNGEPTGKETGEAQRIWLVLGELDSGKIIAKGTARAELAGIDLTPTRAFADSPAWTDDRFVRAYLATCAGNVGDPMDPVYLDGLLAAALVAEATDAYEQQDYERALDYFEQAEQTPAGDQLRVHNGLYMANWGLGRYDEAENAFEGLVDYGFRAKHLSVKFLFRPGSTTFLSQRSVREQYPMWVQKIAERAARDTACMDITGHTSATGPAALNDRLSRLRADYIKERLEDVKPELSPRLIAHGAGSSENIVGTGRDDQTDALDRRVEMALFDC
jgi:outer membrane protein OmpA-like peptidoglycan-associated protein